MPTDIAIAMQVTIQIPDAIATQIQNHGHDLSRNFLEALAADAYRSDILTRGQIQELLGLASLYEVDGFLKQAGAYLHYNEEDLQQDLLTMQTLRDSLEAS